VYSSSKHDTKNTLLACKAYASDIKVGRIFLGFHYRKKLQATVDGQTF